MNKVSGDSDVLVQVLTQEPRLRQLDHASLTKLSRLLQLLVAGQQRFNLTAITEPAAVARLHFADSLNGMDAGEYLHKAHRAADLGSGAGFPLLPLAISTPECSWTAIESVGKKASFIRETAAELQMDNVQALHSRAEDAGRGALRSSLDAVTARAVGPVVPLAEVGLPLLKKGGALLLYKTEAAIEELEQNEEPLARLGGSLKEIFRYRLTGDEQDRIIAVITKDSDTPEKYPRPAGIPFKKKLS